MKLLALRHRRTDLPGVTGVARVDRRTANLLKRLKPGDVAVIDHIDIDRATAEALVAARVAAVVNAAPSISGRYPNLGPRILVDAGVPLVDQVGPEVFARVPEGERIRVDLNTVYRGEAAVVAGQVLDGPRVEDALERAKAGLAAQLEAFAANTTEYVRRERELLLDGIGVPRVQTPLAGRHVLVVVPGPHEREDLAALRRYIRDHRPILVGVDHGAEALRTAGHRPDLIVGDPETVSDETLRCGAELVVHTGRDGRAPGLDRLERLGLECVQFAATGTSEDMALLLADEGDAALVTVAGAHASLLEFLDKGRSSMASTFLVRLRVGGRLVDATAVARLCRRSLAGWLVALVLVMALVALGVALAATPAGQSWLDRHTLGGVGTALDGAWAGLVSWLRELVP